MPKLTSFNYPTIFGIMRVTTSDKGLVAVSFYSEEMQKDDTETELHKKVYSQITDYLNGDLKKFDIPLDLNGTDFQNKVWRALYSLPYGKTVSYKDIANLIGHPKAYRAVGSANNKNPIAIICACHRVIGSDGDLTGYAYGLDMKRQLLQIERIPVK